MASHFSTALLITNALRQIGQHGWTETALAKAESEEGFSKGTYKAYFPAGLADFTREFHRWVDEGMEKAIARQPDFEGSKIREKIFRCVMARLNLLQPYREAVRRLIGHQLLPWNSPQGFMGLGHAADAMWKMAGDRSTDYNYYTKRILLSGVYAATLRFWLSDESADRQNTQEFLRRRIEEVLKVGQALGGLKNRFQRKAA